ncbi:hypothetical protein AOLI_G00178190 [Acnodon oligacanthus]
MYTKSCSSRWLRHSSWALGFSSCCFGLEFMSEDVTRTQGNGSRGTFRWLRTLSGPQTLPHALGTGMDFALAGYRELGLISQIKIL